MNKTPMSNLDEVVRKTVAMDLDGCLAHYDGWKGPDHIGSPIKNMVVICRMLHELGYRILLNTCRLNRTNNREYKVDTMKSLSTVRKWLNDNGLPFIEISMDDGKPFAHAYVDDRGVGVRDGLSVESIYARIMELLI